MNQSSHLTGYWLTSSWFADRRIADQRPIACRSEVILQQEKSIIMRISACEYYSLFINGEYICHGPARSTAFSKAYDEMDITQFLRKGENALALLVTIPTGEISHRGRFCWWYECRDEKNNLIACTDKNSCKYRTADWFDNFCEPHSLSSSRQEHIDLDREEKNWKTMPFAELSESWVKPFVVGPIDWTPPYRKMHCRNTLMQQKKELPLTIAGFYTADSTLFPVEKLADNFNALDFVPGEKTAFDGILHAGDVYVFDLGKTRTFIPKIKVLDGCRTIRLESFCDIRHFDRPQATTPFESAGAGFADSCLLSDSCGQEIIPIVPPGGRFWSLRAAGKGECRISLQLQSLEYPYLKKNIFASDDRKLEIFLEIADQTVRSSTQEVLVDTCWREQSLWTRDAAVAGAAAFYLFGDMAVWKESLRLVGESITADGVPPAVVPAEISHLTLVDQTFCWINALEHYFMVSNDRKFIREMRKPVFNFLSLMRQFTNSDGLFAPPLWSWHFIDWAEVDRRPWSLAINAMLFAAINSACNLFGSTGKVGKFLTEFRNLSQQGIMKFWDENNGYFVNHLPGADPGLSETIFFQPDKNFPDAKPVHGNAILLAHGLFPEKYEKQAAQQLADWLLPAEKSINSFGPSWLTVITRALAMNGQMSAVMEIIVQRYSSAINCHAPTYGEMFPFTQFNSSHGWSAGIAEVLMSHLWGIRIIEPGFRKVSVASVPSANMPESELKLVTPNGLLHLSAANGKISIASDSSETIETIIL